MYCTTNLSRALTPICKASVAQSTKSSPPQSPERVQLSSAYRATLQRPHLALRSTAVRKSLLPSSPERLVRTRVPFAYMRQDMSASKILTPEFLWAQRKDQVYLTVNVPNVKKAETTIKVTDDGHVYFKGPGGAVGHEAQYVMDINLFKPIKADQSKYKITARFVFFKIIKADSGPYWDRLLKQEGRNIHCKIDWDNWKDEDEDEDEYSFGSQFADSKDLQDMDFGSGGSTSDEEDEESNVPKASDK
ncbi:unnamed protein product [Agarophyton chilense]